MRGTTAGREEIISYINHCPSDLPNALNFTTDLGLLSKIVPKINNCKLTK